MHFVEKKKEKKHQQTKTGVQVKKKKKITHKISGEMLYVCFFLMSGLYTVLCCKTAKYLIHSANTRYNAV